MELALVILGPLVGGIISLGVWQIKKGSKQISDQITEIHSCVDNVANTINGIQIDIAKNYCTRDELRDHIDKEEDWHGQHHQEVKELRREFNEKTERLSHDVAEMKDMQWMMRMEQLNRKDDL